VWLLLNYLAMEKQLLPLLTTEVCGNGLLLCKLDKASIFSGAKWLHLSRLFTVVSKSVWPSVHLKGCFCSPEVDHLVNPKGNER